jgi:hypothetical protein
MQVTPVKEDYISDAQQQSIDLPLITLPPGTVLFRGLMIPKGGADADIRYFYKDFIGSPEEDVFVCMNPTTNTFFYPFPFIPFGIHGQGEKYDMVQAFVLVHPLTVVCMISPSEMVRGEAQRYFGEAPIQRCSLIPAETCHAPSAMEAKALEYDNCLLPEYQVRSGTRGWMAIADLDSINSKKVKKQGGTGMKDTPMGKYVIDLERRIPGTGSQILSWAYTDKHHHVGFPELAVFPYKNHPGNQVIKRRCQYERVAMTILENEARADNLMYLPLAAFTKDSTVDLTTGLFSFDRLGLKNTGALPQEAQVAIEGRMADYMKKLETAGIRLPYYGQGKLCFDTRTGFFVLSQLVPVNLSVPVPGEGSMPYRKVLMILDSSEARKRAQQYMLTFRTYLPAQFMKKYGLDKGFGVRRAMVFSRPPVLKNVFGELGIEVPADFKGPLAAAAKYYQKETGILPKAKEVPTAALKDADLGTSAVAVATAAEAPRTPEYGSTTPEYGAATPEYNATGGPSTPEYNARGGPSTPPKSSGGARKTRGRRSRLRTLKRKTRKTSVKTQIQRFARFTSKLWSIHTQKR